MKQKYLLFLIMFFYSQFIFAIGIDSLLNELARKDDLSSYTKKDTAGFIHIFTRVDLDRMKIRSFDELIDKIPFLRNKLDNYGLNDPYYQPYQTNNPSRIRLFINDRELLTPLFGSGLRLLGQMNISYIDHIEVYHGVPSYDIAIEPSVVVIKAYTKIGQRENITTMGTSIGSHGTYDAYAYKSENLKDYSYFAYVNYRNLKRDKVQNLGTELSRDKKTTHVYGQLSTETSNFEIQAVDGSLDGFAGTSWNMTPQNNDITFKYLSTSYSFTSLDKSLKTTLNYTYLTDEQYQSSTSPLGYLPSPVFPFYTLYDTSRVNMTEHLFDAKITKKYKVDNTSFLFGMSNRFKKFTFNKYELGGIDYSSIYTYDSEDILSLFTEINHQLNENNQIILSLNGQKYFENANLDDDVLYGARLGHIYKKDNFIQKSFLFYGKFHPTPFVLLFNDLLSGGVGKIDSETAYVVSTQSLWTNNNMENSLLFARTVYEDGIYFDGTYHNSKDTNIYDTISFESKYFINSEDKIDLNLWTIIENNGKSSSNRYHNQYGASLDLYKKFYFVDTYNSISYVNSNEGIADGWNYNATATYQYSKQLSFFLKGKNLLNKALKSDYTSINPLTGHKTELNNVSNIDRTIWFGLEYQF